ncbi:hypothetical protein DFH06DRAFT_1130961 [Mycena polygramma]|nr:hypothetical protein DFH06DRAFT_1130961 [Mycena polygramma]
MSQPKFSAEVPRNMSCAGCYEPETQTSKLLRCARCRTAAYCGKACQRRAWNSHKNYCKLQSEMSRSLPGRGTLARAQISALRKWCSSHHKLLIYSAVHAMHLHELPEHILRRTHMLIIEISRSQSRSLVFHDAYLGDMAENGVEQRLIDALLERADKVAEDGLQNFTIALHCGEFRHLLPIICRVPTAFAHSLRYGPPDRDWTGFLARAINNLLGPQDYTRLRRLQL